MKKIIPCATRRAGLISALAIVSIFCDPAKAITADQAIDVWSKKPDWASAECQILRRMNRGGHSIYDAKVVKWMAPKYQMRASQLDLAWNWLVGNYCPDIR